MTGARATVLAAACALAAAALYAGRALLLKLPPGPLPLADLVFLQSLFALPAAVFIATWRGAPLMPQRAACAAHLSRGLIGMLHTAMLLWVFLRLPAGLAVTLSFTAPLFYALIAWLVAGEAVSQRAGLGLLAGFAGVALIAWPATSTGGAAVTAAIDAGAVCVALSAGLVGALITFSVRRVIVRGERAETLMVSFTGVQSATAAAWWLAAGSPASLLAPWTLVIGTAVGLLSTLAQLLVTLGHSHGSAALANALSFVAIPLAALGALLWFAERLPAAAWLGAALVAVGGASVLMADLRRIPAVQPTPQQPPAGGAKVLPFSRVADTRRAA